jgi:hypothetical protein
MNDIDDLKAAVDQLLIQQAYLTVKLDAAASLLHTSILQNSELSVGRELLSQHIDHLHQALDQSIESLVSAKILFERHHAHKLKFDVFEEMNFLRRKYGLDQ